MTVLPGVLGPRTLQCTVQVRLGFESLRLPGSTPLFTVSRHKFMKYPGQRTSSILHIYTESRQASRSQEFPHFFGTNRVTPTAKWEAAKQRAPEPTSIAAISAWQRPTERCGALCTGTLPSMTRFSSAQVCNVRVRSLLSFKVSKITVFRTLHDGFSSV